MHNPTLRVILILDEISNSDTGLTLSELSKRLSIPLGTISPIVKTLLNNKFLEFDSTNNQYSIGIKSYFVGASYVSSKTPLEIIRKEVEGLALDTGETCQVAILKNNKVFYLVKIEGKESIRVSSEVGSHMPFHATALGKVLVANLDVQEIKEVFLNTKLEKLTDYTVVDPEILQAQLENIKEVGYGTESKESNENTACIAMPILQNNKCVAAVSVAYPLFRETPKKQEEIKKLLLLRKKNIEKILLTNNLI